MLTVWCVCWGDKYDSYYVQRLQKSVAENLSIDHRFVCITDRDIDGVVTMPPVVDYPGWWQKIQLFSPGLSDEHNLYLDLDVIVVASLDPIAEYAVENFAAPNNWAASGHNSVQSSVMAWKGGYGCHADTIYRNFDPAIAHWPPINKPGVLWGDQEHCTAMRDAGRLDHTPMHVDLVKSYKYHCQNGLPKDCRVVVFHGDPKPADVDVGWFSW